MATLNFLSVTKSQSASLTVDPDGSGFFTRSVNGQRTDAQQVTAEEMTRFLAALTAEMQGR